MTTTFRPSVAITVLVVITAIQCVSQPKQGNFHISGTVMDSVHGDVLSGIEVSLALSQADNLSRTMTTGQDGRFDFGGLEAAKYTLYARGAGYRPQGYQSHHGFTTGIVTGQGLQSQNLIFRLQPDASLSGVVTDEFNDPVSEAEVLLFASIPEAQQAVMVRGKTVANDAGYFHFGDLRDGKYYLVVTARRPWYAQQDADEGDSVKRSIEDSSSENTGASEHRRSEFNVSFPTTYYVSATEPGAATPILLKPGEHATADVHLSAVPALHLKVRTESSFSNPSGSLTLRERIFNFSRQVVSQNFDQEEVEFDGLSPGHYMLESPPQKPGELPIQQPLDILTDLEVVPGQVDKFASPVVGTIQLEDPRRSLERYSVRFVSVPAGEEFVAQPTSQGFEISGGVRPGHYLVWVLNTENYLIKAISATGAKVIGRQIEIPSGTAVRLTIAMTKEAGAIEGVALQDGKPVGEMAIFLVPDDPAHNLALFRGDQSDSDGSFTLRHILPGQYTVIAVSEGWNLEWTNLDALRPYLSGGVKLRVQPGGKHQIKVAVQHLR